MQKRPAEREPHPRHILKINEAIRKSRPRFIQLYPKSSLCQIAGCDFPGKGGVQARLSPLFRQTKAWCNACVRPSGRRRYTASAPMWVASTTVCRPHSVRRARESDSLPPSFDTRDGAYRRHPLQRELFPLPSLRYDGEYRDIHRRCELGGNRVHLLSSDEA